MDHEVLLIIAATALIQSMFGVGVLLFGTPALLTLGYEFDVALSILLPVSMTINVLQLVRRLREVDRQLYARLLIYAVPGIVACLLVAAKLNSMVISLLVGSFMILVAVKEFFPPVNAFTNSMTRNQRSFMVVTGLVHGTTNLGGSLLTALIYQQHYSKEITRTTIAAAYATFAAFQLLTLAIRVPDTLLQGRGQFGAIVLGIVVFVLADRLVYLKLDSRKYSKAFAALLLIMGAMICVKYLRQAMVS